MTQRFDNDLGEITAMFHGAHPQTGEDLRVADRPAPDGAAAQVLNGNG